IFDVDVLFRAPDIQVESKGFWLGWFRDSLPQGGDLPMPKAYSLDLRERVACFVDSGRSRHAAAAHFKVSVSFVVNLMKAYRMTGSLEPKPGGGRRHAKR